MIVPPCSQVANMHATGINTLVACAQVTMTQFKQQAGAETVIGSSYPQIAQDLTNCNQRRGEDGTGGREL
jgi:hypothetical protein